MLPHTMDWKGMVSFYDTFARNTLNSNMKDYAKRNMKDYAKKNGYNGF